MLRVGHLVKCNALKLHFLKLHVGRGCFAGNRKPIALVDPSGCGRYSLIRAASGVGGSDVTSGWYEGLAHSAPVHLCEHFLVGTQQLTGMPWWLTIVAATFSARTVITLPIAAYQQVIVSKLQVLQAEISDLSKRLSYEISVRAKQTGWTEKQCRFQFRKNLKRIVSELYIRENCHPFKTSVLVWVQLPLWISLSLALRNLSMDQSVVHSDLATGGSLWFPDLTIPDSTWILPVCLGIINLVIVEFFALQRSQVTRFRRMVLYFIRGFSVLMIPIAATVPSSMALYWFASSIIGFGHNLFLHSKIVHRFLRLQTSRSDTPYRDLLSAFVSKYQK
ncbi:cytochrome c oxidase assembly protein COX18, mitochondrial [Cynoglossus semilaevis]|uniref:Cytochrome c oxidase assembly factor COX18 n=1 Tax=Cynoglossus semilaevis TaxID=244447 RepID=A0A3P8V5C6_CYNSE|nr:cytochrome c oxidase assembly protein COX18, mitochondrial [Cynoglossus semilaevis]